MSDQQNDRFARPSESLSSSPVATWHHPEALSELIHYFLSKFSLQSLTASWPKASRLSPTIQLDFSWTLQMSDRQKDGFARPSEGLSISPTSVTLSKCPINKMIGSEGHLRVWAYPRLQLHLRNIWSTKRLVRKAIWESERFPGSNITLSRVSFKANLLSFK